MADSKPTDVHVVIKYLGLNTYYMRNIKIMWFDVCVFEMVVNWS